MKKVLFLLSLLVFSLQSFAPIKPKSFRYDPYMEEIYRKHCLVNDNLPRLLDDDIKSRQEVFDLAQPLIEMYLEEYSDNYTIGDSLSYALTCIFVSESSNGRGHSARSTLWLDYYNPFGLTTFTNQGVTKLSWEEEKGKRVVQYRTFKTFNSLEEAVESLMWDYLLKGRYEPLRSKETVKDFLYGLYDCGYMTASGWPKWAYNEIYLKYK